MSKKLILSMILVIAMAVLSSAVLAVQDINITDSVVSVTGMSGTSTGTVHVKNIGTEIVNISFQSSIMVDDSGHSLDLTNFNRIVNLAPGSTQGSNFNVNLNGYAGNYTGVITSSVEGGSETAAVVAKVQILNNGFGLSVTPSVASSTTADSVVTQQISVQNLANRDIQATIIKSGYSGLVFTVDKEGTYTFPALSTTSVTANVVVPAGAPSGVYSGKVNFTAGSSVYTTLLQTIVQPTYKVSVPALSISTDPGSSSSGNLIISNSGNINLTGLSITNLPVFMDNDGDIMNLTATPNTGIKVNVGSTSTVSVLASASTKMDSGTYAGTMTLSGSGISKQVDVSVTVRDIIQIANIDIDEDTLKPGERIQIDVEVENIANDIDLEDVEVEVYFLDGGSRLEDDDGDDMEDVSEEFDLDAGDSDTVSFEFTMPYNVNDGDEFTVHVEAKGKNADDSTEKYSVIDEQNTITAEKEEHLLELYDIRLDSATLSCSRSTYLRVGVRDIGDSDEDDVELAITNAELGISKHEIFDMSSDPDDDDFEVERSFLLDLTGAPVGTYEMDITVYYDDDDEEEEESISLTVASCSGSSSSSTSTDSGSTYVPPSTPTGANENSEFTYTGGPSSGQSVVSATSAVPKISSTKPKASWTDSVAFLVIVGIANLLLVIVIVLVIISLVRK